jgi:hypothetical protein
VPRVHIENRVDDLSNNVHVSLLVWLLWLNIRF